MGLLDSVLGSAMGALQGGGQGGGNACLLYTSPSPRD